MGGARTDYFLPIPDALNGCGSAAPDRPLSVSLRSMAAMCLIARFWTSCDASMPSGMTASVFG